MRGFGGDAVPIGREQRGEIIRLCGLRIDEGADPDPVACIEGSVCPPTIDDVFDLWSVRSENGDQIDV